MTTYQAPCKINLTLRVLGKRDDGFHHLSMIMVPTTLCDTLTIEPADTYTLLCDDSNLSTGDGNLVTRAVREFERVSGRTCQYRIHLHKVIPEGAGLGGGSSDAATVLLTLNELEGTHYTKPQLATMAATFGSDTSFFIYQQPCLCQGRGEIVTPLENTPSFGTHVLLLKPRFGMPTPLAYKMWASSREIQGVHYAPQKWRDMQLFNDLERPVFERFPYLAALKMWLLAQPNVEVALMSGSGSTVFAIIPTAEHANALAARAKTELDRHLWTAVTEI